MQDLHADPLPATEPQPAVYMVETMERGRWQRRSTHSDQQTAFAAAEAWLKKDKGGFAAIWKIHPLDQSRSHVRITCAVFVPSIDDEPMLMRLVTPQGA
jgi:hypothetical protein